MACRGRSSIEVASPTSRNFGAFYAPITAEVDKTHAKAAIQLFDKLVSGQIVRAFSIMAMRLYAASFSLTENHVDACGEPSRQKW